MTAHPWRPVDVPRARGLRDARQQAHHAVQLATALGISFLPPRADDGHTNLEWLPSLDALASNPAGAVRVALRLTDLALLVLRDGAAGASLPLHGATTDDAAAWLRAELASRGLDAARYTLKRHYEIPSHPVGQGRAFDASDRAALAQLAAWFHDGALALERVRGAHAGAGEVRCWPHHFDIGLVIDAGRGRSIGAGMEPGDVYYDEPYFYVNMHPAPDAGALTMPLAGGGRWHTSEWIGAVLPGSGVAADASAQERQVRDFLASATGAAARLLT